MTSLPDSAPPAAGPYLQTVSGRWVNPLDPDAEQFEIDDIARALGNLCRFGGHCRAFYSVAQHSVIVSELELTAWPPEAATKAFLARYTQLDARRQAASGSH